MIGPSIDAPVQHGDLQALVDNQVREGRTIDYKETLPGHSDGDKKEFLADTSSFANAGGGDLVIGMREARDQAGKKLGYPDAIVGLTGNLSTEIERLENILRTGLSPRIPVVRFVRITIPSGGQVVAVRIGESWLRPHMVGFQEWCRFYSRNSHGKYLLDVGELRDAFLNAAEVPARIREFRTRRIGLIAAGETPVPISPGPKVCVHLVPLSAFSANSAVEMPSLLQAHSLSLSPFGEGGHSPGFNVDGLFTYRTRAEPINHSYLQFFRNGSIESVEGDRAYQPDGLRSFALYAPHLVRDVTVFLQSKLELLRVLGVPLPVSVMISLTGVRGVWLQTAEVYRLHGRPFDRDVILLPELLLTELPERVVDILKPVLDVLWQGAGLAGCPYYDDKGLWRDERP